MMSIIAHLHSLLPWTGKGDPRAAGRQEPSTSVSPALCKVDCSLELLTSPQEMRGATKTLKTLSLTLGIPG